MLKKTGDWIIVKDIIPVKEPVDPFSVWYAVPNTERLMMRGEDSFDVEYSLSYTGLDKKAFKKAAYRLLKRKAKLKNPRKIFPKGELLPVEEEIIKICADYGITLESFEYMATIVTPFGSVNLNPHEYSIVSDIKKYIDEVDHGEYVMRFMSDTKQLKGKLRDQIFYLRQRGIGYSDALKLCIGNVTSQHLFYLETLPPNAEYLTRGYLQFARKKRDFMVKNKREDLLQYPDYTLSDYINYLETRLKSA